MRDLMITGKKTKLLFCCLLFTVHCSLFLAGCSRSEKMYRESRILMDTLCTITVVSPSREQAEQAIDKGFSGIEKIELLVNYFSPGSEVAAINRSAGISPVKVSSETLELLRIALAVSDATQGAFDPTIGPLMKLWGFNRENKAYSLPEEHEIRKAAGLVDYRRIVINEAGREVFLGKEGMELDLGGIAKGYAVDKALEIIRRSGVKAALVSLAGDIRGFGVKPDQSAWRVGIQNPRAGEKAEGDAGDDIFATLSLRDLAISTSGDYQRFFIYGGKRYHHIIDPRTGYPSEGIISVSVIAPEGALADGFSTGIFVLGREKGMRLLKSLGMAGAIVDSSREVSVTDNLKGKIRIEKGI